MILRRSLALAALLSAAGCFDSSSTAMPAGPTPDATANDGDLDASANGSRDAASGEDAGRDANDLGDARGDAHVVCPVSTCAGVEVVFDGWLPDPDGGVDLAALSVDLGAPDGGVNGTVVKTASTTDPRLGHENLLVGDFVTTGDAGALVSPLEYANDNNYCQLPVYATRTNDYYLAPMQGLPIDPTWFTPSCGCGGQCGGACLDGGTGGACDYEDVSYSINCPNFGNACILTPRKIESLQVISTSPDATCKVCLYASTSPDASNLIRCVSPGVTLSYAELTGVSADGGAAYPLLVRLDDGSSCSGY
jgi:hypothetical protein